MGYQRPQRQHSVDVARLLLALHESKIDELFEAKALESTGGSRGNS
jgi:hypothetical protein